MNANERRTAARGTQSRRPLNGLWIRAYGQLPLPYITTLQEQRHIAYQLKVFSGESAENGQYFLRITLTDSRRSNPTGPRQGLEPDIEGGAQPAKDSQGRVRGLTPLQAQQVGGRDPGSLRQLPGGEIASPSELTQKRSEADVRHREGSLPDLAQLLFSDCQWHYMLSAMHERGMRSANGIDPRHRRRTSAIRRIDVPRTRHVAESPSSGPSLDEPR